MTFSKFLGPGAGAFVLASLLLTSGCTPPAVHPNQFNPFDGAAYDSLTLAHGALASLRTSVADEFPEYTHAFNQAAESYNQGIASYATFRSTHDELGLRSDLQSLTLAIVLLETELQSGFHPSREQSDAVRASASRIRARAAQAHVTVSDILTELEIATALAQTVPAAQPYARLARAIILATADALSAHQLISGKPIDLATLPTLALLN